MDWRRDGGVQDATERGCTTAAAPAVLNTLSKRKKYTCVSKRITGQTAEPRITLPRGCVAAASVARKNEKDAAVAV